LFLFSAAKPYLFGLLLKTLLKCIVVLETTCIASYLQVGEEY
jgi:hypothetical protein